jgi:hypothetical protein
VTIAQHRFSANEMKVAVTRNRFPIARERSRNVTRESEETGVYQR